MRRPSLTGILVWAALAAGAPLHAGETFIPIARNLINGNATSRTVIWVTNTAASTQSFKWSFLLAGSDGNANPGPETPVSLAAGRAMRIDASLPNDSSGMLRLDGPAEVKVDASLELFDSHGTILSVARVPVLSPDRMTPAGETVHLQGLSRSENGKPLTDFGVANLSRSAASCTIAAFRSTGVAIGPAATITLFPLSVREFPEVFSVLGANQISDARFRVSCDKPFTTYALVYDVGGPRTIVQAAGGGLGDTLDPIFRPGEVTFNVPGDFLIARNGDSYRTYNLPLVPNVAYGKATIDFDMFIKNFPGGLFTGTTSMRRMHPNRHLRLLYYGIQIRNDNKKTNLDLGNEVLVRGSGPWKARTQYHLRFEYDLVVNRVTMTVFKDNHQVFAISGPPQARDLSDDGHDEIGRAH